MNRKLALCLVLSIGFAVGTSSDMKAGEISVLDHQSADRVIVGGRAHARLGYALACGDFDADGLPDLVISSDGWRPLGGTRRGEFEIVWGATLLDSSGITLSDTTGVSRIVGRVSDSPLFASLASGDVNGDGIDDIVIGEPLSRGYDGVAYIVFGAPSFPDTVDLEFPPPGRVASVLGPSTGGWFGSRVGVVRATGEGYCDVVASAPAEENGRIYVLVGGPDIPPAVDLDHDVSRAIILVDTHPGQFFGRSFSCADIDRDGHQDLVVGAPGNAPGTFAGLVTIIWGASRAPGTYWLDDPATRATCIYGEYSAGYLGSDVAVADIDGDLYPELVLGSDGAAPEGCTSCGEAYIVYDAAALGDSLSLADTSWPITRILGSRSRSWFGTEVHATDALDGVEGQVMVSCRSVDSQTATRDTVFVWSGAALNRGAGTIRTNDSVLMKYASESYEERLGTALATADFNADGDVDMAIGAFGFGDDNEGRVFVVLGDGTGARVDQPPVPFSLSAVTPNPFGTSTTAAYDIPTASHVHIELFSVLGRRVATLADSTRPAGTSTVTWNGKDSDQRLLPAGVYFMRMTVGEYSLTRKVVLVR